ncbi:MAG: DUF3459 domain-containing protein [Chitinivibrionales bacterium]|nr:DUF3459 domain-containing protein [Chitinivibrionales bacterium]MBD3355596.1 DUF3459 domain-containing protein [Chitinivibrionales bacterium]
MLGERLSNLVSFKAAKLAAGAVLTAPALPLLFMGEEHADPNPFLYFTSHGDPALGEAVTKGRREEFAGFAWDHTAPDPQDPATFERSKLDWGCRSEDEHRYMLGFYRRLIHLRRSESALAIPDKKALRPWRSPAGKVLVIERNQNEETVVVVLNFDNGDTTVMCPLFQRNAERLIDSGERLWGGSGNTMPEYLPEDSPVRIPPLCFAIYRPEKCE